MQITLKLLRSTDIVFKGVHIGVSLGEFIF